ncbi:DUF5107 domain-containing protein [Nonomuraea sp. NPDC001831]|uniref:DUF5107 domain-containing protein n=1 Tax=Nonomuraea sp. NPDC001831 TaxID=3364340 RepID=UPI00368FA533
MTTTVRRTTITLPVAPPGPDNPLPPLRDAPGPAPTVAGAPPDMAFQLSYGRLVSVLPCRVQDGYDRARRPRRVEAIQLANDRLTATVLPGWGGRLYSLVHRDHGELLHRNPVLQPANFGLTGAWFSGGVEWNSGSTGHTTLTCRPVFAGEAEGPDGTPMLRVWEWERTRDLPYQVDFWLPRGSDFLYVGVRMRNPHAHEVPAYWWSNIAVPETGGTRVLAPAGTAWHFGYAGRLEQVPIPVWDGLDRSYPARAEHAADYFFELGDRRPWIAALDGSGAGLVHTSTRSLRGRKLFLWGRGPGGRRWQDWLTEPGAGGYLEIQAGLARTQLEHVPLPGGGEFSWLEAYGPLRADPAAVHGADWTAAVRAAEEELAARLPAAEVSAAWRKWRPHADQEPVRILAEGSGWGALEVTRAGVTTPGTPFPGSTLGPDQSPWLSLLTTGAFPRPGPSPGADPGHSLVSGPWRRLLERAPETWVTAYHLGVAAWHAEDREGAVRAWRRSAELRPNPWATRCLAHTTANPDERATLYLTALHQTTGLVRERLAAEAAVALLEAGRAAECLAVLDTLPPTGRAVLLRARALLAVGDRDGARALFDAGFDVEDLREGEAVLHDTWARLTTDPLPARYDFRMHPDDA